MKNKVELTKYIKGALNIRDAYIRGIEVKNFGFMLPLSKFHAYDAKVVEKLTSLRNIYKDAFPTQFTATHDSTANWIINSIVESDDRMLFLILDQKGTFLGHIGLDNLTSENNILEISNVVKDPECSVKGLMSASLCSLVEWSRTTMFVEDFILKVFKDNHHAVAFYENNNFVVNREIPLWRENHNEFIKYQEQDIEQSTTKPDRYFLEMKFAPETKVGNEMILTAGPSISQYESSFAFDAALNGWNSQWSKYLNKFEEYFAKFIGSKYAISTSSCTGALQIALMALDIKQGDEVIVPDLTWVATANAVRYVGATPIFADVELDSWNIDIESIKKLVTPKTKAIMPVHMYGNPARMKKIVEFAKENNLHIIEDAAPAIGASFDGRLCGTFGDFGCFSFQGAKLLVTGEGGMLVTDNEDLFSKAYKIWDQGRNPNKVFWIDEKGIKFKMSNVQAAVGLGQIKRAEDLILMKRRIFNWYYDKLGSFKSVHLNKEVENGKGIYWMTSLRLDESCNISRDQLINELKSKNIDSRPVFPSISQYPIWETKSKPCINANKIGTNAINLPSGVCLKKSEVDYISDTVISILERS